jgi:hypothetical protein
MRAPFGEQEISERLGPAAQWNGPIPVLPVQSSFSQLQPKKTTRPGVWLVS